MYEDDFALAFRHRVDPTLAKWCEIHVVIIPKTWIPTLLDFGSGDLTIRHKMIDGIQNVALVLGLYERGFLLRIGVLPPYQHTEHVHIHILCGPSKNGQNGSVHAHQSPQPRIQRIATCRRRLSDLVNFAENQS